MPYLQFADTPLDLTFLKQEVRAFYTYFSFLCVAFGFTALLAGVAGPMLSIPITPVPPWGPSLSSCALPCGGLVAADVVGPQCDWAWLARANYTRPSQKTSSLGACAANSGTKAPPTAYVTALLTAVLPLLCALLGGAGAFFARAQAALMLELGSAAGGVRARLASAAFAVARGPRVPAPERRAWVVGLHLVEDVAWPAHAARLWALFALPPPLVCVFATLHLWGESPPGATVGAGFYFSLLAAPLAGGGFALQRWLRGRTVHALAHPDTSRDPAAAAAMTRWLGLDDGGALFRELVAAPAAAVRRAPRVVRGAAGGDARSSRASTLDLGPPMESGPGEGAGSAPGSA
jgi:hypothetical protein